MTKYIFYKLENNKKITIYSIYSSLPKTTIKRLYKHLSYNGVDSIKSNYNPFERV